jgi:hypothetical protein
MRAAMLAPPPPPSPPPPSPPPLFATAAASSDAAALAAAKARWTRTGSKSYTYKVAVGGAQVMIPEATVVVRGGQATVTPKGHDYGDVKTVPRLFALIARAIKDKPYSLQARYAPKTGVPTFLAVDDEELALDDVWGFGVRGFRRL